MVNLNIYSTNELSKVALSKIFSDVGYQVSLIGPDTLRDDCFVSKTEAGPWIVEIEDHQCGQNLIAQIVRSVGVTSIILFTADIEIIVKIGRLPDFVRGVFTSHDTAKRIGSIVELVIQGNCVFPDGLTQTKSALPDFDHSPSDLTQREVEVLQVLSAGSSNKEIARDLRISANTVDAHVSSIMKKVGVSNRTKLAIFTFQNLTKSP